MNKANNKHNNNKKLSKAKQINKNIDKQKQRTTKNVK